MPRKPLLISVVALAVAWVTLPVCAGEQRISTFMPFEKGDVFVAATVMDDPDDDHAGTGRLLQFDAKLREKGVLWVEGTTHKIGALTFAPDGVLWGFAPISWQVVEVSPDGRQLPMRYFLPRTLNSVVFAPNGHLFFGEHLVGSRRKISFNTTTFNYMPGTERIGDGHIFEFSPDGRLLEEYPAEIHGGVAGIHGNSCMAISDDGRRAIYISETGNRVMQYDLANRQQLPDLADFGKMDDAPAMVLFMTMLEDGRLMLATGGDILMMDSGDGRITGRVEMQGSGWAAIAPSTDPGFLLAGNFFTGEFVKVRIQNGEVVARNTIGEQRSLSGIAQYPGSVARRAGQ